MNEYYNPQDVGIRIRKIRQSLGWSMDKFAAAIDEKAKSGTVSNWETGKNLPNNERLKRIAELGKITPAYLLSGNPIDNLSKEEQEEYTKAQIEKQNAQYYINKFKKTKYPEDEDYINSDRTFTFNKHMLTKEELIAVRKIFEGKEKNYPSDEEIEKEYYELRKQKLEAEKMVSEGKAVFVMGEFHDYDFH